jgi:hypothetical protein
MDRALPRPLGLTRRTIALTGLWTINGIFLVITFAAFLYADVGVDWDIFTEAGRRFYDGNLYTWEGLPYRYSPLLAPLFGLLAPIGYLGWSLLHFAALLTLPRKLALILLVSAPFWNDVYNGNTVTFAFVAAWHALGTMPAWKSSAVAATGRSESRSSNRPPQSTASAGIAAAIPFLVLSVLIPRPMMLPVLAYILWTRREWVVPFALIAGASLLGAYLVGWLEPWVLGELRNVGRPEIKADFGPAAYIGAWWYPVALGLAAWATVRGWLGVASVLAALNLTVTYPMMLLLTPPGTRPPRPLGTRPS